MKKEEIELIEEMIVYIIERKNAVDYVEKNQLEDLIERVKLKLEGKCDCREFMDRGTCNHIEK